MKKFLIVTFILLVTMATAFARALYDTPYIGNSNTMKFHYADCNSVDKMRPEHQVPLETRDEAVQKNFIPCKRCKP